MGKMNLKNMTRDISVSGHLRTYKKLKADADNRVSSTRFGKMSIIYGVLAIICSVILAFVPELSTYANSNLALGIAIIFIGYILPILFIILSTSAMIFQLLLLCHDNCHRD